MFIKKISILLLILVASNIFANCNGQLITTTQLMVERANLMKEISFYKWHYHLSPYSANQEKKVLIFVTRMANKNRMDPLSLMIFAQIQMDISKQIEAYWIDYWNYHETLQSAKLNNNSQKKLRNLRIKIKGIDEKLYLMLKRNLPNIQKCSIEQIQSTLSDAFINIQGIPKHPNLIGMLALALKQLKSA